MADQIITHPEDGYWLRRAVGIQGAGADPANLPTGFAPVVTATDGATTWIAQRHSYSNATGDAPAGMTALADTDQPDATIASVALPGTAAHVQGLTNDANDRFLCGAKKPASDWVGAAWGIGTTWGTWSERITRTIAGKHVNCGGAWKTTYGGGALLAVMSDTNDESFYLVGDVAGVIATSKVTPVDGTTLIRCRSTGLPNVVGVKFDADTYAIGALYKSGSAYIWRTHVWGESSSSRYFAVESYTPALDGSDEFVMVHQPFIAAGCAIFIATIYTDAGEGGVKNLVLSQSLSADVHAAQEITGDLVPGFAFDFGSGTVAAIGAAGGCYTSANPSTTDFAQGAAGGASLSPPHAFAPSMRKSWVSAEGRISTYSPVDGYHLVDALPVADVPGSVWERVECTSAQADPWEPESFAYARPETRESVSDPFRYASDLATAVASDEVAGFAVGNVQEQRDLALGYTWASAYKDHAWLRFGFAAAFEGRFVHVCASRSRGITPTIEQLQAIEAGSAAAAATPTGTHYETVITAGSHAVATDGATAYGVALIHVPADAFGPGSPEVGVVAFYPNGLYGSVTEIATAVGGGPGNIPDEWFAFCSTIGDFTSSPGPVLASGGGNGASFTWVSTPLDDCTVGTLTASAPATMTSIGTDLYDLTPPTFDLDGFTFDLEIPADPMGSPDVGAIVISPNFVSAYDRDLASPTLRLYVGNTWPPQKYVGALKWFPFIGDRGLLFDLAGSGFTEYLLVLDNDRATFPDTEAFELARVLIDYAQTIPTHIRTQHSPNPSSGTARFALEGGGYATRPAAAAFAHTFTFSHVQRSAENTHKWLRLGLGQRNPTLWNYDANTPLWIAPSGLRTMRGNEEGMLDPRFGFLSDAPSVKPADTLSTTYEKTITHEAL